MNKTLKKSIALILGASVVLSNMVGISASADTVEYLAFGDNISNGSGLENPQDSYVYLVADYLNTDVTNYSVDKLTSTELVEMLDSGDYNEEISNADVITLSIGANDVIIPLTTLLCNTVGIEQGDNMLSDLQNWYDTTDIFTKFFTLNAINTALENDTTITDACTNFKDNTLPTIISDIKTLNPDCEIVINEFYNPVYGVNLGGVFDIGSITDTYIQKLNSALDTNSEDYSVAEIYSAFNNDSTLTDTDISELNFNAYPNIEGHKVIANAVIEKLTTQPATEEDNTPLIGDVNNDGVVDVPDLVILKQYVLGKLPDTDIDGLTLNINGDDSINIIDVITLKRILLQID